MDTSTGNYAFLIQKIDEFIRKYYLHKIIRGSIYLAAILFIAFLIVTIAEYLGNFTPLIRSLLFYSFIVLNGLILLNYIIRPLMAYFKLGKTINYEQASEIIGNHFAPVKDKLLNALQLKKLVEEQPQHRLLIEASINQKITELRPIPFASAIRLNDNTRHIKYALAPLIIIVLIFFTTPAIFSESTQRLWNHEKHFVKKAPFNFIILNKNLKAAQGSDFELQVKLSGDIIPNEIYLEDGVNTFKLTKKSVTRFNYVFKNLQQSKKIRLTNGPYSSETYTLEVKPKPSLLHFEIDLEYPAYLNKKNETISNTGDLNVPVGSRITWKFRAQNTSYIDFLLNKRQIIIQPDNGLFKFSYQAMENANYSIAAKNKEVNLSDSITYQIQVIPDLNPTIEVNERVDSINNKLFYFMGQVNDDHGFSKLNFIYQILNEGSSKPVKQLTKSIDININSLQSTFFNVWNAKELDPQAGQIIEYYFEVFDNDGVHGPKSARSAIKTFKMPSDAEMEKKLDDNSRSIKEKTEQAIRQAAKVEKEAKRLNQDLINKKSLDYDDKKQIEQLLQQQKDLEELVKDIQNENKKNLFEQQDYKEQRADILEKQKQIENLFNNVLDDKTRQILKNIEKLLEENNKNQTRNELSNMQVDNKSLQKELDRILELYKQLEFDQKLTESIDKLKDLAKKQQELSEKTIKNQDINSLKQEQESLKKDFISLQKNLSELEQKNNELSQKNEFQNPEKEQEQISQQQEQSSKNLANQERKKAAENQRKAAEQMQALSQKLESMQQEGESAETDLNIQDLRKILNNLLNTSFDQEKLMQTLKKTSSADPQYKLGTQKQKELQDNLKMIEDSLFSLSKRVPQIQSVVNKEIQSINSNVNSALENLSDRRTAEANRNQQYAMTSINNLALMLSEALDQLQKMQQNARQGGKGKKNSSLSQLSKMQEQLNKNMQKAREEMQQAGQSGPEAKKSSLSEQLAKMAREQQLIRQAMQEINQQLNKDGKGGLGNLDKLMKQMEQTETDLVNKKIQQETIIRQQEILSKLLDAEKAEQEREQDSRRESKQGVDQAPNYKIYLQEYQKVKQKETDLLKTVPPALNLFYKIKVGDYFKFLNSVYHE
ncbi:MAG TPA: DUF4175 family protein [Daejeonella sp.]|nr:DUF4175 family protein [Daejeonella sp.]